MDKASKAIRRSGVRLRSAGSGHTDLQLVISELKEMRAAARWFQSAQTSATGDLLKWSLRGENRAIQETAAQLVELNMIWSDVQKTFTDHLKEHRQQFELMLEGENHVDNCKQKLSMAESRESKIRKEYKKALKRAENHGGPELNEIEGQLKQATHARDLAQEEFTESFKENEAVKLIRMKQSLVKLSESYLEMANKCIHVFEAHRDVALAIPEVQDVDQNIKYTGAVACRHTVHKAKEKVDHYRRNSYSSEFSQPPPYNPHYVSAPKDSTGRPIQHRRSSTYPQLEGAWGWSGTEGGSTFINDSITTTVSSPQNDLSSSFSNGHRLQ